MFKELKIKRNTKWIRKNMDVIGALYTILPGEMLSRKEATARKSILALLLLSDAGEKIKKIYKILHGNGYYCSGKKHITLESDKNYGVGCDCNINYLVIRCNKKVETRKIIDLLLVQSLKKSIFELIFTEYYPPEENNGK